MTRRSSPRAQVRALFREMNGQGGAFEGAPRTSAEVTPDSGSDGWIAGSSPAMTTEGQAGDASGALRSEPSPGLPPIKPGVGHPLPQAGEGKEEARRHTNTSVFTSAQATQATTRARALYEDTAVPVREIARRCGVTERTILKYAAKLDWKPRYHWVAGEAGVRHRRWQPAEKFAPVKGAGARFVRRERADAPFAVGLKALDPLAETQASAACEEALTLARAAEADERTIAALTTVGNLVAEIRSWRNARRKELEREALLEFRADYPNGAVWREGAKYKVEPRAIPDDLPPDRVEEMMWRLVGAALTRWEACLGPEMSAAPR